MRSGSIYLQRVIQGEENPERVILLNPIASGCYVWEKIVKDLVREYEVVLMEYPGFGDSVMTPIGTIEGLANHIATGLGPLPEKPTHLVGYSFGAWIAQRLAANKIAQLTSLALLGSSDRIYPQGLAMIDEWMKLIENNGLDAALAQMSFWTFRPAIFESIPDLVQIFVNRSRSGSAGPKAIAAQLGLCKDCREPAKFSEIRVPTLILRGAMDILYPQFCAERLRDSLPNSILIEVPNCGHAVVFECAAEVLRHLKQFWKRASDELRANGDRSRLQSANA